MGNVKEQNIQYHDSMTQSQIITHSCESSNSASDGSEVQPTEVTCKIGQGIGFIQQQLQQRYPARGVDLPEAHHASIA